MVSSGVASLIIASWPGGKVRSNLFPWRTQLRKPQSDPQFAIDSFFWLAD